MKLPDGEIDKKDKKNENNYSIKSFAFPVFKFEYTNYT